MIGPRSTRPGRRRTAVVSMVAAVTAIAATVAMDGGTAAAAGAGAGGTAVTTAGAAAATGTQLRVAHFSPDTPPMDVYATGFDGHEQLVLPKLGYGQVSEYMPLAAGLYAFSMRPAGSPVTADAVLDVSAELAPSTSYMFAAFGRQADLSTDLLTDDLSAPAAGQGRVRLIQAAIDAGPVDVSAGGGPFFARGAELGAVGSYVAVPAGSWEVTAEGESADPVVERLTVEAGTVNSLVVLDKSGGAGLQIMSVTDAAGATTAGSNGAATGAPAGGIDTGGGGLADGGGAAAGSGRAADPLLATSAGLLAVLLVVVLAVGVSQAASRGRRRRPA